MRLAGEARKEREAAARQRVREEEAKRQQKEAARRAREEGLVRRDGEREREGGRDAEARGGTPHLVPDQPRYAPERHRGGPPPSSAERGGPPPALGGKVNPLPAGVADELIKRKGPPALQVAVGGHSAVQRCNSNGVAEGMVALALGRAREDRRGAGGGAPPQGGALAAVASLRPLPIPPSGRLQGNNIESSPLNVDPLPDVGGVLYASPEARRVNRQRKLIQENREELTRMRAGEERALQRLRG